MKAFPLLFLAAVLVGCSQPVAEPQVSKLVGAWRSKVQFQTGPFAEAKDLEFLFSFNQGGTFTESSNYDGAPPVPPAYGAWRETGPNRFELKYVYFNSKAPGEFEEIKGGGGWMPNGHGEIKETITLAADGNSFDSSIDFVLYDATGKEIEGGGKAVGKGVRIGF